MKRFQKLQQRLPAETAPSTALRMLQPELTLASFFRKFLNWTSSISVQQGCGGRGYILFLVYGAASGGFFVWFVFKLESSWEDEKHTRRAVKNLYHCIRAMPTSAPPSSGPCKVQEEQQETPLPFQEFTGSWPRQVITHKEDRTSWRLNMQKG